MKDKECARRRYFWAFWNANSWRWWEWWWEWVGVKPAGRRGVVKALCCALIFAVEMWSVMKQQEEQADQSTEWSRVTKLVCRFVEFQHFSGKDFFNNLTETEPPEEDKMTHFLVFIWKETNSELSAEDGVSANWNSELELNCQGL